MRLSKEQKAEILQFRQRIEEGGLAALRRSDLRTSILMIRGLTCCGERISAEGWHKSLTKAYWERFGIQYPPLGGDFRFLTNPKNGRKSKNGGRPSSRPAYCSVLAQKRCRLCPKSQGWNDCQGNPIGRTWGAPSNGN